MCLCAFLYFTEFFPLNINYFCNQKKHTAIKVYKKKIFPIQFLRCLCHSVTDRFPHNSVQKEPIVHGYPRLCDVGHGILKTTEFPKISINCKDP